jgi:hypothetical protein
MQREEAHILPLLKKETINFQNHKIIGTTVSLEK